MIKPSEAKKTLENILKNLNFDMKNPNVDLIFSAMKEFSKIKVDCSNDDFLFQCGVFDFTGVDMFYLDFVRQFVIYEDSNYDHMEQLHFEVMFMPNKELENFLVVEWSTDNLEIYFDKIRLLDEFLLIYN